VARRAIFGTGLTGYVASAKVPNACIHSLGMVASTQAIAGLQELDRTVKHAGYRKQVIAALAAAAQSAGLSLGELAERTVPDGGLNEEGERVVMAGGRTARLKLSAGWRIRAEWQAPRGWARTAPAATPAGARHAGCWQPSRHAALGGTQLARKALAQDRSWALSDWQTLYLGYPITGSLSRFDLGVRHQHRRAPDRDASRQPPVRHPRRTAADSTRCDGQIAAPARAGTAEVQVWRVHLVAAAQAQPFKQAFREVYLRTPAELQTRLPNRSQPTSCITGRHALFKQRADGQLPRPPTEDTRTRPAGFAEATLSAIFHHYPVDTDPEPDMDRTTDRVSFAVPAIRHTPVPLKIPELVFTEALRDVDLFVSVTSIALDPHWADRGDDPHYTYWRDYSFGELSQTAAMRREALARLLPKLKIAPHLELGDRHLRVKGKDSKQDPHRERQHPYRTRRPLPVHCPGRRQNQSHAPLRGRPRPQRHRVQGRPPRRRRQDHRPGHPEAAQQPLTQ
jgi:hypothetical protein